MKNDPKIARDNRSRQLNEHDVTFHRGRGAPPAEAERLANAARERGDEPPTEQPKKK